MSVSRQTSFEELRKGHTAGIDASFRTKDSKACKKNKWLVLSRLHGGWRTGVAWGALGAILVLIINISILIWVKSKFPTESNGSTIVYKGSCKTKTSIFRWSHLLINVCSTLLLGASNNGMQCLSSPARADIDRAHKNNIWLDIGIQSIKNLLYVGRVRVLVWTALLLSSLPLHLFYNSVISASISTYDYMVVLTTEDFTSGAAFDRSYKWSIVDTMDLLQDPTGQGLLVGPMINYNEIATMQANPTNLTRLSNTECATKYNSGLISDFSSVLLITNTSRANSILNIYSYASTTSPSMPWFCDEDLTTLPCLASHVTDKDWTMLYSNLTQEDANADNMNYTYNGPYQSTTRENDTSIPNAIRNCSWNDPRNPDNSANVATKSAEDIASSSVEYVDELKDTACHLPGQKNSTEPISSNVTKIYKFPIDEPSIAHVQYCLAQPQTEHCKISFSGYMLSVVIFCNATKVVCLFAILLLPNFTPIVCIGDAISSFLTHPDPYTFPLNHRHAITSAKLVRSDWLTARLWKLRQSRWFAGGTVGQWYQCYILLLALWISSLTFLLRAISAATNTGPALTIPQIWSLGFGSDSVHSSTITSFSSSFLGQVLAVNSPQLLASATYLSYNLLMTSMVMTAECNDFAVHRKTLRTSQPRGRQRGAYYLQLPYRYAVPLMVTCGVLHWLISQSFFLVNLMVRGLDGESKTKDDISACGWSPVALVFTLMLGGGMAVVLVVVGVWGRYSVEMPIFRGNSLRISAACHSPRGGFEGEALWPIEYGVVELPGEGGQWRACFTSRRDIVPLTARVPRK